MSDVLEGLSTHIHTHLEGQLSGLRVALGELMIETQPPYLLEVLQFLRDDPGCRFRVLMDLCGVDYPHHERRFQVVYNLLSLHYNTRIRVKVAVDDGVSVPSCLGLFPAAGWFEREAWDMFGIVFAGNPDLRRILTDYGFEGHPLRKDFPLTGNVEVRYDPARRAVVYEPVQLVQEFRVFDALSPWEGAQYILPGDEKASTPS